MGIFRKKKEIQSLNNDMEIDLFKDDLESEEFLEKVKGLTDINKKFQKGLNLLHFAAEYNQFKLAKELILLGINIDDKNSFGNTPLWTAVFNAHGNYELVDLLLKNGANPLATNNANNSPLKFAETIKDEELVLRLKKVLKD